MWHLKSKHAHFSSARLERAYFGHFKLTVVKHGLLAIEHLKKQYREHIK